MKKILALVLALTMLCGVIVAAHADDDKIKIGVSIWRRWTLKFSGLTRPTSPSRLRLPPRRWQWPTATV